MTAGCLPADAARKLAEGLKVDDPSMNHQNVFIPVTFDAAVLTGPCGLCGASAIRYASAKAASIHLARCLALEGAEHGIRVNVVNPDAVIRGSKIWDGDWRKERADSYGIDPGEELEEFYRKRSLLKLNVLPEDIAEAVWYFASSASAKSTGNILNVDAGNAQAFTR